MDLLNSIRSTLFFTGSIIAVLFSSGLVYGAHTAMSTKDVDALIKRAYEVKAELKSINHNIETDQDLSDTPCSPLVRWEEELRQLKETIDGNLHMKTENTECISHEEKENYCNTLASLLNEWADIMDKLSQEKFNCWLKFEEFSIYIKAIAQVEACEPGLFVQLAQKVNNEKKINAAFKELTPLPEEDPDTAFPSYDEYVSKMVKRLKEAGLEIKL